MAKRSRVSSVEIKKASVNNDNIEYVNLVNKVRDSKKKQQREDAFAAIEEKIRVKIKQIAYRFNIPGYTFHDIYQEALIALRFKAIKDYDPSRGNGSGPYPFDKFAILCIRRHLSTKLKASYQNKKRVWISCLSLDQDRNEKNNEENLFLSDIVPHTKGTVLDVIEKNEYIISLLKKLHEKLSPFEQEVFRLYIMKHSYEEIAELVKKHPSAKKIKNIVKSVDNGLSRIKQKSKKIMKAYEKALKEQENDRNKLKS